MRFFVRLDAIRIIIYKSIDSPRENYIPDVIRRRYNLPARYHALINLNDYTWSYCLKHRINCGKR